MNNNDIISFIRKTFRSESDFIPLHAPTFGGNEKKYVMDTIDSTFVSSVGAYVNRFEELMCEITNSKYSVATVNGTTALHLALVAAGVQYGMEVLTQSLTFVATANAISHAGGIPVFVDVDKDTMGMSPDSLEQFLKANCTVNEKGQCINKTSNRVIAACLPMHTFGFPCRIDEIAEICHQYNITLVEDSAESLGSSYKGKHTGNFGLIGVFSFNGNKTVTSGGGGAIVTNNEALAKKIKHLSTTAKLPHSWEFYHDAVGYNYRMPNLNAALACAQLEQLSLFVKGKRELATIYRDFFKQDEDVTFVSEIKNATANYWLNTILFSNLARKKEFLEASNQQKVMTRPVWALMNELPMYSQCQHAPLPNAKWLEERLVNIPSSYLKEYGEI